MRPSAYLWKGTVEQGEECDDGSNTSNDGCSFDCKVEKCFGVVCTGSDDCHGVCDPATGECSNDWKPDNTPCNDSNACTKTDQCVSGVCVGGNPVSCPGPKDPNCYGPGVCDTQDGTCSNPPIDKIGCNIFLHVDGVVDMGGNNWIAIFSWESTATSQFHPTTNTVSVDTGTVPNTSPPPPAYLIPGNHPGGFLAQFIYGQTITWSVDSNPVSASATDSTIRTYVPLPSGGGQQVDIGGGTMVTITPDMGAYSKAPVEPTPADEPKPKSDNPF